MQNYIFLVKRRYSSQLDSFNQFIKPFEDLVWCSVGILVIIFSILISFGAKMSKVKNLTDLQPYWMIEKTWFDYLLYPFGTILSPLANLIWLKQIRSGSLNGYFSMFSLVVCGFLVVTFYKNALLSHLSVVGYEKPIETIEGV